MRRSLFVSGVTAATLAAAALLSAPAARADFHYNVQMNTSSLIGHVAGPFSLDFQLIDGDGVANNTVTLTNFVFGGGSPSGAPTLSGGASGDLSSAVALTDTTFLNEFTQGFTPGNTLSFSLTTTNAFAGSGVPDAFSFAILDRTGAELPTASPSGAFLQSDFGGLGGPTVQTFASDPNTAPAGGGSALTIPAPTVQIVGANAAPEPTPAALLGATALPLLGLLRRTARQRRPLIHPARRSRSSPSFSRWGG
jgi:hypothetical protein